MQSIFMASTKMSCTNIKCGKYSINPNSKSSMGGSKKLGEMELAQLEACGFKACLQEFKDRSDACVVKICNKCRCVQILCFCSSDDKKSLQTFEAILSASSIKAMIGVRVCDNTNTQLTPQIT
jgi:hypothetical protein